MLNKQQQLENMTLQEIGIALRPLYLKIFEKFGRVFSFNLKFKVTDSVKNIIDLPSPLKFTIPETLEITINIESTPSNNYQELEKIVNDILKPLPPPQNWTFKIDSIAKEIVILVPVPENFIMNNKKPTETKIIEEVKDEVRGFESV